MSTVPISRESLIALAYVEKTVAAAMMLVVELERDQLAGRLDGTVFEVRCRALFATLASANDSLHGQIAPLIARLSIRTA